MITSRGQGAHQLAIGRFAPGVEQQLPAGGIGGIAVLPGRQRKSAWRSRTLSASWSSRSRVSSEPLLEGLATRQAEARQELAAVERGGSLQIGGGAASGQAHEAGHIHHDCPASQVTLSWVARRWAAAAGPRAARRRVRAWERLPRARASGWSGQNRPARVARAWGAVGLDGQVGQQAAHLVAPEAADRGAVAGDLEAAKEVEGDGMHNIQQI